MPYLPRSARRLQSGLVRSFDLRDQLGVLPDRHAVLAPIEPECPARQAFTGIPFALSVMQQAAGREPRSQLANEIVGEPALGRADRGNIPFRRFQIVDGNKGRLAAHRQPHVASVQVGIDLLAEPVEASPGLVGERPGDPRRFADPLDVHFEAEFDLGESDRAADRRRRAIMRRGRNGNMPFTGQHARSDVESDPARAGKVDFGPGVQVREIVLDFARPFDRIDIRAQLNEITRDEAGGEPEVPQGLDQQPRRVAARPGARGQRFLRRLDTRLHAYDVANFLLQLRVEIDQKIDRARRLARNAGKVGRKQRSGLNGREIRSKFGLEIGRVDERENYPRKARRKNRTD